MTQLHIPANTAPDGIPSGAGTTVAHHAEDLKPEVNHALEAKRQIRQSEGHRTSERLEKIKRDIADTEQLKADTEAKLDETSPAVADGQKGAEGQYRKLSDELRACIDKLDALQRAHFHEERQLSKAYADKLERAQQLHRQQIRDAVDAAHAKLETVEADLQRLETSMAEARGATRLVASMAGSATVGLHAGAVEDALRHITGVRLGMHGDPGPGNNRDLPVTAHALDADDVVGRATVPEYLADLPDPDA